MKSNNQKITEIMNKLGKKYLPKMRKLAITIRGFFSVALFSALFEMNRAGTCKNLRET